MAINTLDKLTTDILDIGFFVGDAQLLINFDDCIWDGKAAIIALKNIEQTAKIKPIEATNDSIYEQLELLKRALAQVDSVKTKYSLYEATYRAYIDTINKKNAGEDVSDYILMTLKNNLAQHQTEATNASKNVNDMLAIIKGLKSLTETNINKEHDLYYINLDRVTPEIVSGVLNRIISTCEEIKSDLNSTKFNDVVITIELGGTRQNYVEAYNTRTITTTLHFGAARSKIQTNLEKLINYTKKIKNKVENHIDYITKFENNETVEIYVEGQAPTKGTETKEEPKKYTVKKGDTLIAIASAYGITWQELYNANKNNEKVLPNGDYKKLVVGENLVIPGQYNTVTIDTVVTKPVDVINDKMPEIENYEFTQMKTYNDLNKTNWAVNASAIDMDDLAAPMILKNVNGDIMMVDKSGKDPITISDSYSGSGANDHRGTDFIGGSNDYGTPIQALGPGIVIAAEGGNEWNKGYGNYVRVLHEKTEGDEVVYVEAIYEHLSKVNVATGEVIDGNEAIGEMGNSGNVRGQTGIHLHMEV
ncbi:MAG: M23 family metallopeptidase, partial [Bacilli bacterium]|nr:M23 family metallopeptidase [Bacilli bacterium]